MDSQLNATLFTRKIVVTSIAPVANLRWETNRSRKTVEAQGKRIRNTQLWQRRLGRASALMNSSYYTYCPPPGWYPNRRQSKVYIFLHFSIPQLDFPCCVLGPPSELTAESLVSNVLVSSFAISLSGLGWEVGFSFLPLALWAEANRDNLLNTLSEKYILANQ